MAYSIQQTSSSLDCKIYTLECSSNCVSIYIIKFLFKFKFLLSTQIFYEKVVLFLNFEINSERLFSNISQFALTFCIICYTCSCAKLHY